MITRGSDCRVAVLLSTYNGEPYLREQLDSLLQQTHDNWVLYWRDDGSTDGTLSVLKEFAARAGQGRCVRIGTGDMRLGATRSFLALLQAVAATLGDGDAVAFADQDDVWLPEKLARGLGALLTVAPGVPALYCAQQILVDANLDPIGTAGGPARWVAFPSSLTQNIATGCTVMLNRGAVLRIAATQPSLVTVHDWWCYLVVTACNGQVIQDVEPVVLYRQHGRNLVGAPRSMLRRGIAALRRGPHVFMTVLRQNVAALVAQQHLLSDQARRDVLKLHAALNGGLWLRLGALRMPGLYRQTWPETLLFRCWFLLG